MKFKKLCVTSLVVASIFTIGCNKGASEDSKELEQAIQTIKEAKENLDKREQEVESSEETSSYEKTENTYYIDIKNRKTDYDIEEIKQKNLSGDLETMNIYKSDIDNVNEFEVKGSIEISNELSKKERLILLCNKIEELYKLNSGEEIALYIEDIIDDKYAVISAAEKYPMDSYYYREKELKETLNQPKFEGDWFDKVVVVYDGDVYDI